MGYNLRSRSVLLKENKRNPPGVREGARASTTKAIKTNKKKKETKKTPSKKSKSVKKLTTKTKKVTRYSPVFSRSRSTSPSKSKKSRSSLFKKWLKRGSYGGSSSSYSSSSSCDNEKVKVVCESSWS